MKAEKKLHFFSQLVKSSSTDDNVSVYFNKDEINRRLREKSKSILANILHIRCFFHHWELMLRLRVSQSLIIKRCGLAGCLAGSVTRFFSTHQQFCGNSFLETIRFSKTQEQYRNLSGREEICPSLCATVTPLATQGYTNWHP